VKTLEDNLKPFFWETEFSKINLKENSRYVIERILEFGDEASVQWLFSHYSRDEIKRALKGSKNISKKSRNFWSLILEIQKDV
jgi:hypothetical protein